MFAREGANIIAADTNFKNAESLTDVLKNKYDGTFLAVNLNVEDIESVHNALEETIRTFKKPPEIVVNSAGITRDNFILKLSENDFDRVLNVNLKVFYNIFQILQHLNYIHL